MGWVREHVLLLLSLYEQNYCLYDPKNKDYYNRTKRENVLENMCRELQKYRPSTTVPEIKGKLKTLRSQYTCEKLNNEKWRRNGNAIDEVYEPKLWCYQQLQFLDGYLKERHNTTHLEENVAQSSDSLESASNGCYNPELLLHPTHHELNGKDNNCYYQELLIQSDQGLDKDRGNCYYPEILLQPTKEEMTHKENNILVPPKKKKPKNELLSEAQQVLHLAQSLATGKSESREDIFAKFVAVELKEISDNSIYNQTKWKIQVALMEGLQKQAQEGEESCEDILRPQDIKSEQDKDVPVVL